MCVHCFTYRKGTVVCTREFNEIIYITSQVMHVTSFCFLSVVTLCNAVTSITAMCVCVSLPCCHLFIPIESSIELYTHNTPVCLSCIHMTHLYFLVKALVVYSFGFG